MFLLCPLLIGLIIYYTAVDIRAFRKRERRRTRADLRMEVYGAIWDSAMGNDKAGGS